MMRIYKLTIRPLTSFLTPLQSDTIFGHLLWALRYTEGEDALVAFLNRYRDDEPPLLVSAGFPEGTLPVPVLQPQPEEHRQPTYLAPDWRILENVILRFIHGTSLERRLKKRVPTP